jgi:bifunctional non-homologous end joining protein LigD
MSVLIDGRDKRLFSGLQPDQLNGSENEKQSATGKKIFVVHRHLSSVLHYDLRIQVNGVLKSWALPSGPSMNAEDRRFAILIEDKPLSFATQRGLMRMQPDDGIMELWDKGVFVPHSQQSSDPDDKELLDRIRNGRISFTLRGKKLRGVFTLIRMADPRHWMLLKGNDRYSVNFPYSPEAYVDSKSKINMAMLRSNRISAHGL